MMTMRTSICSGARRMVWLGCCFLGLLWAGTARASAADDFGQIVHEIEARYHVHRNFRFLMGLAGLTVRMTHIAGAKDVKMALFDDQHLDTSGSELDEVVMAVGARGWQPLVRSFDRRSGEHTYIYARNAGNDLRVLLVTVEPNEGVVLEVTVNQKRLPEFIDRHQHHGLHPELAANEREQATELTSLCFLRIRGYAQPSRGFTQSDHQFFQLAMPREIADDHHAHD